MHSSTLRSLRPALAAALVLCALDVSAQAPALGAQVDAILARYRKSIVLLADQASLDEEGRERSQVVGRMLFEENREALVELTGRLQAAPAQIAPFLDIVEKRADLR